MLCNDDPGGLAVSGVGLQALDCCDREFNPAVGGDVLLLCCFVLCR